MRKTMNDYKLLLIFIVILWGVEMVNLLLKNHLNAYSLHPRDVGSLYGVITMHFLHNSVGHLLSNTMPLLVLGFFVSALNKLRQVTLLIMLMTGILVWIFARDGIHVGASGVVMGYWGYLISNAYFNRSLKNILIAVITLIIYSGVVFTLFNFRSGISFEAHIFGFISGVFCAWLFAQRKKNTRRKTIRGI
jgi:membrane associated rhomboid family serine protease